MPRRQKSTRAIEIRKLRRLADKGLTLAVDTEFEQAHTLTIQVARRRTEQVIEVLVYRSPAVPLPTDRDKIASEIMEEADTYQRFVDRIKIRPIKTIRERLSPASLLRDATYLKHAIRLSLDESEDILRDPSSDLQHAKWNDDRKRWDVPTISVELIAHFWTADFLRIFGEKFYSEIFNHDEHSRFRIEMRAKPSMSFSIGSGLGNGPVLDYLSIGEHFLCGVRIETSDNMLPFGSSSLDRQCEMFLGLGKSQDVTLDEKTSMLNTFRAKTSSAFKYAITDSVNTLLVREEMIKRDREIYSLFEVPEDARPKVRGTCGGRISDFLVTMSRRNANGSELLASVSSMKRQWQRGGFGVFKARNSVSRYREQTAKVYGGLLFSRSPTQFWHQAPNMLRDVDMSGCYNRILAKVNLYLGQPIVLEPGSKATTLAKAVRYIKSCSPNDGWFIKVTGSLSKTDNVLIPSTANAITHENFRNRRSKARAEAARAKSFSFDPQRTEDVHSALYSKRIEQGVVTNDTWTVIQALPDELRREYEKLRVESIVFYHNELIAQDGSEFDQLYKQRQISELPWGSSLEGSSMLVHRECLDHEYVSLRFPISQYAVQLGEERDRAKAEHGKGSSQDIALKIQSNSMFGVLTSEFHPTANIVGANVITARARAEAFLMQMALNGIQVITDGCSYRRDRIPSCTFRECLKLQEDYALRHDDLQTTIPFHAPEYVPIPDPEFTNWYRRHVAEFFETECEAFQDLVATHTLEHKSTGSTDRFSFDAMTTDGSGNYTKIVSSDDDDDGAGKNYEVAESKLRSYRENAQEQLHPWIMESYRYDRIRKLPPIVEDKKLLKLDPSIKAASDCFTVRDNVDEVRLPLGLSLRQFQNYRVLKPSAFVCQTPKQHRSLLKTQEKLQRKFGVGLDIIIYRRGHKSRRACSLVAPAERIYSYIQSGKVNFSREFNLRDDRLSKSWREVLDARIKTLREVRADATKELLEEIDIAMLSQDALLTGLMVSKTHLSHLTRT